MWKLARTIWKRFSQDTQNTKTRFTARSQRTTLDPETWTNIMVFRRSKKPETT
jgi:hypothetical protein